MIFEKRKDGSGVRLNFRVRSTMGAGPGAPLDADPDGDGDGPDDDPYGEHSEWANNLRRKIAETGEEIRRLKRETEDLGFVVHSTMGAGPGETMN